MEYKKEPFLYPVNKVIVRMAVLLFCFVIIVPECSAFWIWTPKSESVVDPKNAVKDTPREQYQWAMELFEKGEFQRAADEFNRLTEHYPDSSFAPDAQYHAGRSFEELAKYYFAFQNYQKTIENYPYTDRMDEILKRQFNIARIFQNKETSKLMDMELTLSLDRAINMYKKIADSSPFGKYADRSLFNAAQCHRRLRQYNEAIELYERIMNDYPNSELAPEARYQLAYTRYEASLDPEYDQEITEEALKQFKEIVKNEPVPKIAEEADKVYKKLKNRKAKSVLKVAKFYEDQDKYRSALIYYRDVSEKYSDTEAGKAARKKVKELEQKVQQDE